MNLTDEERERLMGAVIAKMHEKSVQVVPVVESILSARLDALQAHLDAKCAGDDQATLDRLHAENGGFYDEIERLTAENAELREATRFGAGRVERLARQKAEAERDALRDACTTLADEWHARAYSGENIIDGVFNECEVELRALMSPHECDHHRRDFREMSGDTKRKCVKCGSLSEAGERPHEHKWLPLEISGEAFLQCACGETTYPDGGEV